MRDLHAAETTTNGRVELDPDDLIPTDPPSLIDQHVRAVRRDQGLASMAGMILDTARIVEPLMNIFSRLALSWFAVLASTGLAFYALRNPSWERGAIVGGFMILIGFIVRFAR